MYCTLMTPFSWRKMRHIYNWMLAGADEFAMKWGLKLNYAKTEVMFIGQSVDPYKKWALGEHIH